MLRRYLIYLITISVFPYLTSTSEKCNGSAAVENLVNRSDQIQSIAKYILDQLGYSQPPDAPSDDIPDDKLADYHMQKRREHKQDECNSQQSDAVSVSTIKGGPMHLQSASESGSGSDSKRGIAIEMILYMLTFNFMSLTASGDHNIGGDAILASYDIEFDIKGSDLNSHSHLVELMVYKENAHCSSIQKQQNSFQLVEIIEKSNASQGKVIAVEIIDVCDQKGYISFDVTKAAVRWIQQNLRIVDLILTVKCISSGQCDLQPENQVRFSTSNKQMKRPHLIVETFVKPKVSMLQNKRRKRATSRYPFCSNNTKTCCLKELTVNFKKDLGWNFVKKPEEIYVNYCDGLCPLGTSVTPSHFELLAGIHSSSFPCCSGATYEPVTMLVANSNGTTGVLELPKMTVTSCQCG